MTWTADVDPPRPQRQPLMPTAPHVIDDTRRRRRQPAGRLAGRRGPRTETLPPAAELERVVADDIAGLVGLQNDDGGWPVWQRFRRTEPYHTIQATHALIAARVLRVAGTVASLS